MIAGSSFRCIGFPSIMKVVTIIEPEAGALASGRLSPLLAVEIALAGRAPANRLRTTYADPADEYGEFALGRAAHPRRTSLALRCDRNPLATSPINPADVFTFKWISNADMPGFKLARWRGPVPNRNTTGTVRPFKGLDARRRTIAARH
jgi:hypothetical protein